MSVTTPQGFRAAGVAAGLKSTGAKDVALIVNDGPAFDSATVFTANRCKANPVLWSQQVVKDGTVKAVVLNSGGANCYTGPEGFQTTHAVAVIENRVADSAHCGSSAPGPRRTIASFSGYFSRVKVGPVTVPVTCSADWSPDSSGAWSGVWSLTVRVRSWRARWSRRDRARG